MMKVLRCASKKTISFWDQGTGPTILFIHGSNQSKETFKFQFTAPELQRFRLLAPDLPGHGRSESIDHFSMRTLTDVIGEFIDQVVQGPLITVGLSLGGHVTLGLLERGVLMNAAVLVATPPAAHPINMAEMFQLNGTMGLLYKNGMSSDEKTALAHSLYSKPWDVHQELHDLELVSPEFRNTFPASLVNGEHINEQEFIQKLRTRLMIMTGDYDGLVNNAHISRHTSQNTEMKSYPAGHNLHQEVAAQFNRDLAALATAYLH